jgi:hypothetical protein
VLSQRVNIFPTFQYYFFHVNLFDYFKGVEEKCQPLDLPSRRFEFQLSSTELCYSNKTYQRRECKGGCDSFEESPLKIGGRVVAGNKQCNCCSADKTRKEHVELTCFDSETGLNREITAEYELIETCKCNQCGGGKGRE